MRCLALLHLQAARLCGIAMRFVCPVLQRVHLGFSAIYPAVESLLIVLPNLGGNLSNFKKREDIIYCKAQNMENTNNYHNVGTGTRKPQENN